MSKSSTKATITAAMIEEQTAAFLKSGGAVVYVGNSPLQNQSRLTRKLAKN